MAPTPPARPVPPAARHLRASDLRGMVHLAAQATVGVSRIAEGVHQAVWSQLGMPAGRVPGRTRGVTGLAYRSVEVNSGCRTTTTSNLDVNASVIVFVCAHSNRKR